MNEWAVETRVYGADVTDDSLWLLVRDVMTPTCQVSNTGRVACVYISCARAVSSMLDRLPG